MRSLFSTLKPENVMRIRIALVLLMFIVAGWLSPNAARAAQVQWAGPAGGLWSNSANWKPGTTPGVNSDVVIQAGQVVEDVAAAPHSLTLGAGAKLTIQDGASLTWNAGSIAGTLTVNSGATLSIPGTGVRTLDSGSDALPAVLNNLGAVVWTGPGQMVGGDSATISNAGTFLAENDGTFSHNSSGGAPTFNNLSGAHFTKTDAVGAFSFSDWEFVNSGVVDVASGTLNLTGDYTQTASGGLIIEMSGASPGDQLGLVAVGGTASLAGSLTVKFLDGYTPPIGSTFVPLTYGAQSSVFGTIILQPVAAGVGITAAYSTFDLTLASVPTATVALHPDTVTGGVSVAATITIPNPAPAGGVHVNLGCSNTAASVQGSLDVSAGSTKTYFTVKTNPVSVATAVKLIAVVAGGTQSATLTVLPPVLTALAVNTSPVTGGSPSTGTVTLNGPAPNGGLTVALSSSDTSVATTPPGVTVPAGKTSATFSISTTLTSGKWVTITAARGGITKTASLLVTAPPVFQSVSLAPATVGGGNTSTGTVTLTNPAPTGGVTVALSSSFTAAATVPATVIVPANSTTATFDVHTVTVTRTISVVITGSALSAIRTGSLTVVPIVPAAVKFIPASVTGGFPAEGTVTLTQPAPPGGKLVTLQCPSLHASAPGSVVVVAGSISASFAVQTRPVATASDVQVYAGGGATAIGTLHVLAPTLLAVGLNASSVGAGGSVEGAVTLTGPAPNGGVVVALGSDKSAAVVPATVTVQAGSRIALFVVKTTPVVVSTLVTITAIHAGASQTTTLIVVRVFTHAVAAGSPAPSGVTATAEDGIVTIRWTAVVGATRYTVKRSLAADGPYEAIGIVQAPTLSLGDTAAGAGMTWYYVVLAGDASGDGPGSTPVEIEP